MTALTVAEIYRLLLMLAVPALVVLVVALVSEVVSERVLHHHGGTRQTHAHA